jgi:hypothetical protein
VTFHRIALLQVAPRAYHAAMNNVSPRRGAVLAFVLVTALATASVSAFAAGPSWLWGGGETVKGSGTVKKQDRTLGHFTGIALALPAQVEVRIGSTEGVSIETDDNLLPLVATKVEGGTLQIRPERDRLELRPTTLKVIVQAKNIEQLAVGGSGTIRSDAIRSPRLQLSVGGSGAIEVAGAESDRVSAEMGGTGSVKVGGGATRRFEVAIGGSGGVQAGQLRADEVEVSIGGSGDVTVWAREKLSVAIAGSGDVAYWGDPKVKMQVVGSGGTKRLGAAPK